MSPPDMDPAEKVRERREEIEGMLGQADRLVSNARHSNSPIPIKALYLKIEAICLHLGLTLEDADD